MKLSTYIIALATLILFTVGACKKELDINTDPNNAADVDVNLLLPSAQAGVAFALGNSLQITGGIWAQYWTQNPSSSQYRSLEQYSPSPSSYDNVWITLNSDALEDLQRVIDKSQAQKLKQYEAVATLLKAYTFQLSTDLFGDIPYTEALKGDKGILNPKYDSQRVVYDSLFLLVNRGLALIDPADPNHPGNDDLIYKGDMGKWRRFGNTLKLKLALRLSEVAAAKAASEIASIQGDFLKSGETALISYTATGGNQNPLYSAIAGPVLSGTQNLVASSTAISFYNNNNDPRVGVFYNPTGGNFIGIRQGDYANPSVAGTAISFPSTVVGANATNSASALAPVKFLTDYEAKFLQAEAVARGWLLGGDPVKAEALYRAGIEDNFKAYGLGNAFATYIAQPAVVFPTGGSLSQKVGAIITQKWAAMNGTQSIEAWIEWRRTGYPSFFTPSAASIIGSERVPQAFLYPTVETTRNRNTPPQRQVYDRVWWDVN